MPIDRIHQFLIDAGLEPGEPTPIPAPVEPVVMTATAPERADEPYGVHRCAAPPGMVAIQAVDANGQEFGYFRIRASAFNDAMYDRMASYLGRYCPNGRLKLVKD